MPKRNQRIRRKTEANNDQTAVVELFPFLSIFVCILGVLSFIQLLIAVSGPQKVKLKRRAGVAASATAYQIYCFKTGFVSVPPVKEFESAINKVPNKKDKQQLLQILDKRKKMLELSKQLSETPQKFLIAPNRIVITSLLEEISTINRTMKANGVFYREFLLFGLYPGGGNTFFKFKRKLETSEYMDLEFGIEALNPEWKIGAEEDNEEK